MNCIKLRLHLLCINHTIDFSKLVKQDCLVAKPSIYVRESKVKLVENDK